MTGSALSLLMNEECSLHMFVWWQETAMLAVDASGFTERLWAGLLAVAANRAVWETVVTNVLIGSAGLT